MTPAVGCVEPDRPGPAMTHRAPRGASSRPSGTLDTPYNTSMTDVPAPCDPTLELPPKGRLLGVDFGTVRVGLAVSDSDRLIASPLETLTRRDAASDAAYFQRLVTAERVVGLVVGLPLHMSGDESQKSGEARAFGAWLAGFTGLPVVFWDERHSSSRADDLMTAAGLKRDKRKGKVDRVAAQLILQSYLEAGCPPAGYTPPELETPDSKSETSPTAESTPTPQPHVEPD